MDLVLLLIETVALLLMMLWELLVWLGTGIAFVLAVSLLAGLGPRTRRRCVARRRIGPRPTTTLPSKMETISRSA